MLIRGKCEFLLEIPRNKIGKISAQPHTTLYIQLLDRENNDKNNTLPLGKQICLTIVGGCAEIFTAYCCNKGELINKNPVIEAASYNRVFRSNFQFVNLIQLC